MSSFSLYNGLISATDGDVTLRGHFLLTAPDSNEVIGVAQSGVDISFYLDHIGAEIFVNGESVHLFDAENPLYGFSTCGRHVNCEACRAYHQSSRKSLVYCERKEMKERKREERKQRRSR